MKMKLFFTLCILFSFTLNSQGLNKIITYHDYYKTQIYEVYTVIAGTPTKHGNYKAYNEEGRLILDSNFKNGILNGECKEYFDRSWNGIPIQSYCYGKLGEKRNYLNGELHGENFSYTYDESGTQKMNAYAVYNKGYIVKDVKYNELGKLVSIWQPNGLTTFYYPNGYKKEEFYMLNKKKNGKYTSWYENGKPESKCSYIDEIENDSAYYFHKNGKISCVGKFLNGYKIGKWFWYDSLQRKLQELDYDSNFNLITGKYYVENEILYRTKEKTKDNIYKFEYYDTIKLYKINTSTFLSEGRNSYKHGLDVYYFENGDTLAKGEFNRDQKNGIWYYYYKKDVIKCQETFGNNNSVVSQIFYYSNGKIKSKGKSVYYKGFDENKFYGFPIEFDEKNQILDWEFYKEDGVLDYKIVEDKYRNLTKKTKEQFDLDTLIINYNKNDSIIKNQREEIQQKYYQQNKPEKKHLVLSYEAISNNYDLEISNSSKYSEKVILQNKIFILNQLMLKLRDLDTKQLEKELKKSNTTTEMIVILKL
jgi:antitoxin component YwqK of YwqJK toxin-antitoxin module